MVLVPHSPSDILLLPDIASLLGFEYPVEVYEAGISLKDKVKDH